MKKLIALLFATVTMFSCFIMSVSAAPKDDVVSAAKENIPSKYEKYYLVTLENVLESVSVTQDQADKLVKLIKDTRAVIKTDKGITLHNYSEAEEKAMIGAFNEACDILNLTYKFGPGNSVHKGDVKALVYDSNGKLLCALDGDIVKKTDVDPVQNNTVAIIVAVLVAISAAGVVAFVVSRRAISAK